MAQAEDLNALRSHSKAASDQLDEEQQESVMSLAHVLDTISATESVAHVESRVAFLERQLERLLERREDVEQAITSDLSLMRARVEDAVKAMAETTHSQESLSSVLEERLAEAVDLAERKIMRSVRQSPVGRSPAAGVEPGVHAEMMRLAAKVDELITKVSAAEARWSGQKNHFDATVTNLAQRIEALETALGTDLTGLG